MTETPTSDDRTTATESASESESPIIDTDRHPAVRRVADVVRSTTPRPRTLLIDDEENILQAIHAGVVIESLYVTPQVELPSTLRQAVAADNVFVVADAVVKQVFSGDKRSRVFALARAPRPARWSDITGRPGDIVVLDGVRIAGNIGAIIRSAAAFDAAGVVLVDSGLTNVYDRRVVRSSRGLSFSLPVLLATANDVRDALSAERIPLASLAADGDAPLPTLGEIPERLALLLGSERVGASDGLEEFAEQRFSVPMSERVESLNVSVAAGITLYERRRGRMNTPDSTVDA